MDKLCTICKKNFRYVFPGGKPWYWCRECLRENRKEYSLKNKEKISLRNKEWFKENRARAYEFNKKSRQKRRLNVLKAYSGEIPSCACCGESYLEFLTIDHMNGGGKTHRKTLGDGGQTLYSWLKNNNYPPGFRVLCYNCNSCYGHYNYCPHQKIINKN